ncbi:hypothetical protein OCU04_001370 [Sclerotinia nivalis]|nr:hypothetical protein OCU04_001370 [Sclerotinia nivalis]
MPYTFTTLKHQAHTERRKMVSAMYSHSYIYSSPALLKITRSIIDARFIPKIRKQADENDVIDVLRENKSCMMDITSAFLFGQSQATNFLQNSNEAGDFFETYQPSHYGHFWRTEFYSMARFLAWFGIHLVPKQAHKARREVKIWCANMCDGALSYLQTHVKPSFESTSAEDYPMVYAHFRKNLQKVDSLSERNIEEMMIVELLDHLFASHDIPGITTAYVMYQLSQHIEMQRELRAELQGWKKESGIESFHELDKLPLLDAIFMETLRRHGPNPGPWPRYTSKESTRLGEYFDVPPGTIFSASSYCLHRNAEVFPEPEKWLPERWMNIDMQKEKQMRSWFWAFGAGSRGCFGRHFAIYTMKALIAAVYIEFETRVVDGSGMEQSDGFIAGPVGEKVLLRFHRV